MKKKRMWQRGVSLLLALLLVLGNGPVYAVAQEVTEPLTAQEETAVPEETETLEETVAPEETAAPEEPSAPEETAAPEETEATRPVPRTTANAVDSGSCGENLTWTLSEDGLLTISGQGAMKDYGFYGGPWVDHGDEITAIAVQSGVTYLGSYAFAELDNVRTLWVPESVASMGEFSFGSCEKLTVMYEAENRPCISTYYGGPSEVTNVHHYGIAENGQFYCVRKDNTVVVTKYFGESVHTLEIPETIEGLPVTEVGSHAYYRNDHFRYVTLPETVTVLRHSSFGETGSLLGIWIPATVKSIENYSFSGSATTVMFQSSQLPEDLQSDWNGSSFVMMDVARFGETEDFFYCITNDGIAAIGKYLGQEAEVVVPAQVEGAPVRWMNNTFKGNETVEKVTVSQGIEEISDECFRSCNELWSVDFAASVKSIGEYCFTSCGKLTDVTFRDGLESIGRFAFWWCDTLETLVIPGSIKTIGMRALCCCHSMKYVVVDAPVLPEGLINTPGSYTWNENVTVILGIRETGETAEGFSYILDNGGTITINGYSGEKTDMVIPSEINGYPVTQIMGHAFNGRSDLTGVTIPETIRHIGHYAFYQCTGLEEIRFYAEELPRVGEYNYIFTNAGINGSGIRLTIGAKVRQIPAQMFNPEYFSGSLGYDSDGNPKITQIVFEPGSQCEFIGYYTFAFLEELESITFSGNAPDISYKGFYKVTADAYYPGKDPTWTASKLDGYGGNLTWIPLLCEGPHTEVVSPGVAATCTEAGMTEGRVCSYCGEILAAREEIPAKGHREETIPAVAPTCTQDGKTAGKKCSVCQEILEPQEIVPKGHQSVVTDPRQEATCTEDGLTEGSHCEACGEVLVSQQVIPAPGHSFGPWEAISIPTCNAEGEDQRICTVCREIQYRDTRISGDPGKILVSDPVAEDFFNGKVLLAIGDSITAGTGTTAEERYHYLAAQALGMTNINGGTSGAVLCPGGHLPNKFADLMTAEILTKRNVDVVTIALGVNDWDNGVVNGTYQGKLKYDPTATYYDLGTFGTDDTTTIYGAAKMWCERILELKATESCKDIQFIFLTPVITSYNKSLTNARDWNQDKTNVFGYTLRQCCSAIMEVCAHYGIPVLDMNLYSGMYYHSENNNNVDYFGGDGIHPGPNGHAMMADALAEFLREGYHYENRTVENCGHSYEATVKAPTCTEGGYTENRCPECHYSFLSNETPATGHKEVTDKASAPTCTEPGLTEGKHCETCGEVFQKQEEIPATGHSYRDTVTASTATGKGCTTHTCTVCGDSYADSYTDELGQLSGIAEVLTDGQRIVLTPLNSVMHHKCLIFSGTVSSLGDGVIRLGHGKTHYSASYLELTAHVLRIYTLSSSLSTTEYAHGLTLEGNVKVRVEVGKTSTKVVIETESGTYSRTVSWFGKNGEIFCETEGTELTDVDLRWYCSKADAPIWLFGDSWFGTSSAARWTSYLLSDGHSNVLLNGYGGNGAPAAYEQFRNMLEIETPEYAVWCMGMNNGDRNGTVNSSWVTATEKFIALCEEKGIIPILATIPTTPKVNNRLKNAWVEASGYRYIDFDLALVQNHVTGEWYEGTAASDLNHPTTAGAQLLYPQLHADFPELAEGNREGCTHKLAYLQAKQPECVDGGRNAYYVCTLCAAAFLDEGATQTTTTAQMLLPPVGHSYDEGTVTKEATEETEGEIRYTCTVCAAKKTEVLPKLPHVHKWLDSNAAIKECTSCGHVEGGYRIEAPANEVWIDGVKQKVYSNATGTFLQVENTDAKILTVYTYNDAAASDPHTQYPTGMQVWQLRFENGAYTAQHIRELDDLLGYAGASIRVKGIKGIRILTTLDKALRSKLMDGSLGYTLLEYGTCVVWASDLGGSAPVLGDGRTMWNFAYKQNVADLIFADTGSTIQYTNVLVGFTDDQLAKDLVMRPYIILEDSQGQQITLYGGCITRSIAYVAKQNQNTFPEGSKADAYIEDMISKVYG